MIADLNPSHDAPHMSFLIIGRERYALQLGETILGGDADELLALSPIAALPPFAVVVSGIDPMTTIRALPGGPPVELRGQPLAETPAALTHGDRLAVGSITLLYGDAGAVGRTAPLAGVDPGDADLLARWEQAEGTAATGGRLVSLATGEETPVPDAGLAIGRDPECGLVVNARAVSRRHATIAPGLLGYTVTDESTNGILLNGVRVEGSALLRQGDRLRIGDAQFRFQADHADFEPARPAKSVDAAPAAPVPPAVREAAPLLAVLEVVTRGADEGRRHRIDRGAVKLGRASHNDIRIADESVSGTHATLLQRGGGWHLVDLGSRNGSYVDGERVTDQLLATGCEIRLGNVKLVFRALGGAAEDQATRGIVGLTEEMLRARR